MAGVIQCPHCAQQYAAQAQLVGTQVRCQGCQQVFVAQVVGPPTAVQPTVAAAPQQVAVACPHCQQRFAAGPQLIGTQVACPNCRQAFVAQAQGNTVQQPAAPVNHGPLGDGAFGDFPLDDFSAGGQAFPAQSFPTHNAGMAAQPVYQQPKPRKPAGKAAVAGAGSEFIRGVAGLVFGVVLLLVAVVGSIHSYRTAAEGGEYTIWSGAILFGIISAGYGAIAMVRGAQMQAGHVSKSGEAGIDRLGRAIKGWHVLLLIPLALVVMLILVFTLG